MPYWNLKDSTSYFDLKAGPFINKANLNLAVIKFITFCTYFVNTKFMTILVLETMAITTVRFTKTSIMAHLFGIIQIFGHFLPSAGWLTGEHREHW